MNILPRFLVYMPILLTARQWVPWWCRRIDPNLQYPAIKKPGVPGFDLDPIWFASRAKPLHQCSEVRL